ncbi:MAG: hypothetical protein KAX13_07830 [Candidatus Krumholzibacteria bacterium]|nr:hypothetical protein [Candidatus Krumholzibacteria bacterium]
MKTSIAKLEKELVTKYGSEQKERAKRGMKQVASLWRKDDGDASVFEAFVLDNFAGDQEALDAMFTRFEHLLTIVDGHMNAIGIEFCMQTDLVRGPVYSFDEVFAAYSPGAHVRDDFFKNSLAFVVVLNFPLTTLEERLKNGERWSRREWAEVRLAQIFSKRVPAEVNLAIAKASALSDQYIAGYNIWMHHLLDSEGKRPFPEGMRLLSHWNLRDELKANYQLGEPGLEKQRMIRKVMERIVDQSIPEVVIDNPHVDWDPFANTVSAAAVKDSDLPVSAGMDVTDSPEPDTRYSVLLETFLASKKMDPYSPTAPSLIARRFDEDREIPEEQVRGMLEQVCGSPLVSKVAKLIEERLGRPLEAHDIWYNGFRGTGSYNEEELNRIVSKKYPDAKAFDKDMPRMLRKLGFSRRTASYLAEHIVVEPARGSGHASGGEMPGQVARLRTRVGPNGMDYKGYNIATHEMGHNVEQVFSLNDVDHPLLKGVPNTAFTEAIAFIFQARDLELLGLDIEEDEQTEAYNALNEFWGTCEIAAVSLVDMEIWHWMYDHPEAKPAELKQAVLQIAKDVWNKYYAPVLGEKDVTILAIYSHIIHSFLYLPDYPIGGMIAFQIEEHVKESGKIGKEVERMTTIGNVTPDLWMNEATGSKVGADALIAAAKRALEVLGR